MAKVLGVGGIFFKAQDPAALAAWYAQWLNVPIEPSFGGAAFLPGGLPGGGYTVWAPFQADTTYFQPSEQAFMFNLIVDDLDAALAQVEEGGAARAGDLEESEFGRFGWFIDPAGNKVELWQPPPKVPGSE